MKECYMSTTGAKKKILELLKESSRPRNISEIKRLVGFGSITATKNSLFALLVEDKVVAEKVGTNWFFSIPTKRKTIEQSQSYTESPLKEKTGTM